MEAEAPFTEEAKGPSIFFHRSPERFNPIQPLKTATNAEDCNGDTNDIDREISESLDRLSTEAEPNSDSDEQYRKKARVGNHYQARIPKYFDVVSYNEEDNDELLWDPFRLENPQIIDDFLQQVASITKLLIPMGNHQRDDEQALFILQKHNYDIEAACEELRASQLSPEMSLWSEEECRNFESGILSFGKNFFLIQKYKVNTRNIGELVQFYYLWKKTERYDLFANRMRTGKKKYSLNPGISDLMARYFGGPTGTYGPDVQFVMKETAPQ